MNHYRRGYAGSVYPLFKVNAYMEPRFSTFAYAMSSVLLKRYAEEEDTVMMSGYQFLMGGLVMIALVLVCIGICIVHWRFSSQSCKNEASHVKNTENNSCHTEKGNLRNY